MKSMLLSAAILALATSSSFAAEAVRAPDNSGPLVLTATQLDKVVGGALVNVTALNNVGVAANVAATVLGQSINNQNSNASQRNPIAVSQQ
jgi:hypothetical protein